MTKILLIDDSKDIAELIENGLKPYFVEKVESVADAEKALRQSDYDLVLIDVILPDGNGFDFCMKMAEDPRHSKTLRILLTGKDETSDKVFGFTCGADDYVTKPFHMAELRARIDRHIKRKMTTDGSMVMHSCFLFNLEFMRCFLVDNGKRNDLGLTPTEFRLFYTLAKNQGNVLTRRFLEIVAWESQGAVVEKRGIDTHIAHIRKKLGPFKDAIVSVYGQGYCFEPLVPE